MQEFENNIPAEQSASEIPWFKPAPAVVGEENAPQESVQAEEMPAIEPPACSPEQEPVLQPAPAQEPVTQPKSPKAPRKKKAGIVGRIVAAVLVVALILGSSGLTMYFMDRKLKERDAQMAALEQRLAAAEKKGGSVIHSVTAPAGQSAVTGDFMTPAQVYEANLNSVVLIKNVISNGMYTAGGTGSGFILTQDGYVVTNHHVIEGGGKLSVVTADGTEYPAELIGSDDANDVAVLKIEADNLQSVTLGDSDALTVGDQVTAIGNPLGVLTSTLTVGYVSAKERDVNTSGFAINMLQTDAAINSGNSGGPLFNMYGHVVGITTAKYSGSSSSGASIEGIGFAIPINDVRDMLEDFVEHGYLATPYLGVSLSDMNAEGAAYYGLPMGAYVNSVVEGHCAHEAGIQAKDIIVKIGDYEVNSVNSVGRALRKYEVGQTVDIVVSRAGAEKVFSVTLDERPADEVAAQDAIILPTPPEEEGSIFDFIFPGLG